jgi:hypothetical protein
LGAIGDKHAFANNRVAEILPLAGCLVEPLVCADSDVLHYYCARADFCGYHCGATGVMPKQNRFVNVGAVNLATIQSLQPERCEFPAPWDMAVAIPLN